MFLCHLFALKCHAPERRGTMNAEAGVVVQTWKIGGPHLIISFATFLWLQLQTRYSHSFSTVSMRILGRVPSRNR
jgi:hypothetical protein